MSQHPFTVYGVPVKALDNFDSTGFGPLEIDWNDFYKKDKRRAGFAPEERNRERNPASRLKPGVCTRFAAIRARRAAPAGRLKS
jgi:hypothetical protein